MAVLGETIWRDRSGSRTLRSVVDGLGAHSRRPAIVAVGEKGVELWTYGELAGLVRRLAGGLRGAGVGRGDHVALLATIVLFWKVRRPAALLLLPYLAWILFATVLNYEFLRLNPDADGAEGSYAVQRIEL